MVRAHRSLSLDGCRQVPFIDTGLLALDSLQNITVLNLQGSCTLTDAGLAALAQMHSLAIVNLQDCRQITGKYNSTQPFSEKSRNAISALIQYIYGILFP